MSDVIPRSGNSKNAKYAYINASASGATQAVAAPGATSKIRVLALNIVTTAENTVKFRSGTTDITATTPLVALGGMVLPFNEHGWFECAKGEALNFSQSVATPCAVNLVYTIVD